MNPYVFTYLVIGVFSFIVWLNHYDDEMCFLEFFAYAALLVPFWLPLIAIGLLLDRVDSIVLKKVNGRRWW